MASSFVNEKANWKNHIIFDFNSQEWKFLVHYWLSRFWALAGIWVIFLTANGLTLTQVAIVEAVYMGSIFLFEIPTGFIADKFGRKKSLMLAYFTQFIGIMMFAFSTDILITAISFGIWGIGQTMASGADQAWLYDEVLYDSNQRGTNNTATRYQRVYGLLLSVSLISTSLSYVVGGYLALTDLRLPIILTAITFLTTTIWLSFITENPIVKKKIKTQSEQQDNSDLKQALKNFKSTKLIVLTAISMILGGIVTAFFYWMQPYMVQNDVSVQNIGWLLGFGVLLASFGSSSSNSLTTRFKDNSILFLLIVGGVSFLIMGVAPYFGVISLFFVIRFLRGAFNPFLSRMINQCIPSEGRTTTISIISALTTFTIMLISLGSAWIIDSASFNLFFMLSGVILLSTIPLVILTRNH